MASSGKTDRLCLNRWTGADSPKMSDFNEDNRRLDEFAGSVPTREQLRPHLIYPADCRHQDGIFYLDGLPEDLPDCSTIKFISPVSYGAGEIFQINGRSLSPSACDFTPLPAEAFKATAVVSFEADLEGGRAFFKLGGAPRSSGNQGDEETPESAPYNIFFGDTPPEDKQDGIFVRTSYPVNNIVFSSRVRRKGELDPRYSFKMPEGRYSFTPFLYGDKIYCMGGRGNSGTVLSSVKVFDVKTHEWSDRSDIPTTLADYMLGVVGDKAYIIGGRSSSVSKVIYSYHIPTDSWTAEGTLPSPITSLYFSGAVVVNGLIYLMLGTRNGSTASSSYSYAFDPETLLFTDLATNSMSPTWVKAVERNGIIYLLGRNSTTASYKGGIWAYSIESNLWTLLYSDPQNRMLMGVCISGSLIYVTGGGRSSTLGSTPMDDLRVYDTDSDLWSDVGTLPHACHSMGLMTGPEGIYCIGGTFSAATSSGDALARLYLIWDKDDTYPEGTLVLEHGAPNSDMTPYEAKIGEIGELDITIGIRRAFYSDGIHTHEVPFMVKGEGSGWVGPA